MQILIQWVWFSEESRRFCGSHSLSICWPHLEWQSSNLCVSVGVVILHKTLRPFPIVLPWCIHWTASTWSNLGNISTIFKRNVLVTRPTTGQELANEITAGSRRTSAGSMSNVVEMLEELNSCFCHSASWYNWFQSMSFCLRCSFQEPMEDGIRGELIVPTNVVGTALSEEPYLWLNWMPQVCSDWFLPYHLCVECFFCPERCAQDIPMLGT